MFAEIFFSFFFSYCILLIYNVFKKKPAERFIHLSSGFDYAFSMP